MAPARATFTRLTAVVVLLSGGYGTSVVLHRCPHHQGMVGHAPPQSRVQADPAQSAPDGSAQAASAPAGSMRSPAAASGSHGSGHDAPCTCTGACCGSAVAPLASSLHGPAIRVPDGPARAAATWPLAVSPRPAPSPYFHSFANPPPSAG